MLDKLEEIKIRFEEVGEQLVQPETMMDMKKYSKLSKEYKDLDKVVKKYLEYKNILSNIDTSKKILETEKDPDFREMAKIELDELYPKRDELEDLIKDMLIPKDPNDSKNAILEIRAGTGGDEAAIFAGDLFRMYQRFAEKQGWRMELLDYMEGSSGGFKEITAMVSGE